MDNKHDYTEEQLKDALASLLCKDEDGNHDGHHCHGFANNSADYANHKLSMLQTIHATQVLDYGTKMSQGNDNNIPSQDALLQQAKEFASQQGSILNLQQIIQRQSPRMALAAEFKRASPSKGNIAPHLKPGEQAQAYASSGANIISVLTEPRWFLGSLDDLTQARLQTTNQPSYDRPAILRKDFVFCEYQIAEAAASGADTVLLIVAVTPRTLLKKLIDFCRSIDMEPLVEVHADEELDVALEAGAKVIGVNNRNLHTFQMDMSRTQHVAEQLGTRGLTFHHDTDAASAEYTVCALSGMSTALDVDRYRQSGVGMCLIGESLMRAADPSVAIQGLCLDPADLAKQQSNMNGGGAYTAGTKIIKVCGITTPEDALVACQSGANLIGTIFAEKSKRKVTKEQATSVVQAVRTFGERNARMEIPQKADNGGKSPIASLVSTAHILEDCARRPLVVGVFQNQSFDFIQEMVKDCGLDLVQLHGKEGMTVANAKHCGVPAIRVVDIEVDAKTGKAIEGASAQILKSVTSDPLAILLDTSIKGSKEGGGTGVTFDWNIVQEVQNAGLPVIIAGGLKPENVPDAVTTVRPWGIDVSSGVEQSPGLKDHSKVETFVKGARAAAVEASKGF